MATSTPWGPSQHSNHIARGIIAYSTAGHGGIHLTKTRVAAIPDTIASFMRKTNMITSKGDAWLEQDSNAAFAVVAFQSEFKPEQFAEAEQSLKNWHPDAWEAHFKKLIQPGESTRRDEEIFKAKTQDLYVCIAAYGSWAEHVPEGMVGVCATIGGVRINQPAETYWLVPKVEYDTRDRNGFIVDPDRHQRLNVVLGSSKAVQAAEVV